MTLHEKKKTNLLPSFSILQFFLFSPHEKHYVFAIVTMNQPITTRFKILLNSSYITIQI